MQARDRLSKPYLVWKTLAVILMLNFVVWPIGLLVLGGEAVNGGVEDGKYYVAGRKGRTEVSQTAYYYSLCHTYSVYILGPVCLIAILVANRKRGELRDG